MAESFPNLKLESLRQKLPVLLLTGTLLLLLPGLAIIVLVMILIRISASRLAPIFRPDLGHLLEPSSASFAVDLLYNKVHQMPLLITVYLKGTLEVEVFRAAVRKVMKERDPISGELLRPELQQYPVSWFGLLFWKWDRSFDITKHVRMFTEYAHRSTLNEDDLLEIGNGVMEKPFAPSQSPWEFLILHNTRQKADTSNEPRTTVALRVHHSLGDGYSLLKLVMEDMSNVKLRLAKPKNVHHHAPAARPEGKLLEKFLYPIKASYEMATAVLNYDLNSWHIPESQMSRRLNGDVSEPIPLHFVKGIKEDYGVTFTAVLLAAFTGGIRNFMLEKGHQIPDSIHCFTILPFPNHPLKLLNHLTGGYARLPLGLKSSKDRLEIVEANLQALRKSTVPTTMFYLMKLAGVQFSFFTHLFCRNLLATSVMSNFPGPENEVNFIGLPILDGGFAAGFGPGNTTIGLTALSYNGKLRIAAGIDEAVLPRSVPCKGLIEKVIEELHILAKNSRKHNVSSKNALGKKNFT